MNKRIYIYRIYFPTSGKSYIGQTNDLQRRMKEHLESGKTICHALNKYDDWYRHISILHTCKSRDEANRVEIEEIRNYNSVAPNGYNLTHGGGGSSGYHHTKEACKAISINLQCNKNAEGTKHTDKTKELWHKQKVGENNPMYSTEGGFADKRHTIESKNKIGLANSKRIWTEESKKKSSESHNGQNIGFKNPMKRMDVKIKHRIAILKYYATKLQQELGVK